MMIDVYSQGRLAGLLKEQIPDPTACLSPRQEWPLAVCVLSLELEDELTSPRGGHQGAPLSQHAELMCSVQPELRGRCTAAQSWGVCSAPQQPRVEGCSPRTELWGSGGPWKSRGWVAGGGALGTGLGEILAPSFCCLAALR